MVGIAPSQILLALALAFLLLSEEKLQLPPIKLPLGLFLLGTLIALAFSENPAAGMTQVRKMYVFLTLLVVFSLLRDIRMIRWLVLTWAVIGGMSATRGIGQFVNKIQQARALGRSFYTFYVGERITGFMSHWNTFSVLLMFALIMLVSFLFFAPESRRRVWAWILLALVIGLGLLLAETRGVWIASVAAGLYLLWFWRRRLVLVVPIVLLAGFFLAPASMRQRFTSILRPSSVDSNQFRVVTWRTGLNMIKQHPLLGLGPEMPRIKFEEYVPAGIPRPLPEGSYIHLHNIYLHYAAERGIPTLLMFLWLMGKILFDFWRGLRTVPPGRDNRRFLLHGGIAVVLSILIEGVADVNLGDSEVLAMFLVIVAICYTALAKDVQLLKNEQPLHAGQVAELS